MNNNNNDDDDDDDNIVVVVIVIVQRVEAHQQKEVHALEPWHQYRGGWHPWQYVVCVVQEKFGK